MKRVLENDFLKVAIDDHGAELVSIYDKEKGRPGDLAGRSQVLGASSRRFFFQMYESIAMEIITGSVIRNMRPSGMAMPVTQISHVLIPHWIP